MNKNSKLDSIKVCKVRESAKLPHKTHSGDAGFDVFYCPDNQDAAFINTNDCKILPTGLKVRFPQNYVLEIKNRSGMASKGLLVGACIVDSTYSGEIFINLHNVSNVQKKILPGDKIAQFLIYEIQSPEILEVSEDDIKKLHENSSRKDGAFGSTGNT
jgi:dUTP pyrophosphatase